ncbi:hypothetical protein COU60_01165 [Candidatus Pacearchaeota archaeon CG10_big_fil_rev_8_21_14_0_10_34_76]|nr:MAG: hypothetical protein COU60_01165 [Candidatus Pacearchaeota archaeon CG10_big_fil_rev_8_21_14_0_10_34_76]
MESLDIEIGKVLDKDLEKSRKRVGLALNSRIWKYLNAVVSNHARKIEGRVKARSGIECSELRSYNDAVDALAQFENLLQREFHLSVGRVNYAMTEVYRQSYSEKRVPA